MTTNAKLNKTIKAVKKKKKAAGPVSSPSSADHALRKASQVVVRLLRRVLYSDEMEPLRLGLTLSMVSVRAEGGRAGKPGNH